MRDRWLLAIDLAVKALLVGLLLFGALSGLEQFEDKAFGWRLLFALSAAIVPTAWWLAGKPAPYPYAIDILVVAPFLVDVLGNTFDLYDTIDWWDDANHFVNWMLLSLAIGLLAVRLGQGPWATVLLVTGLGATLAILWEAGEYIAFIRGGTEEATAYTDTLGDELLGLAGSFVAGVVAALLARSRSARLREQPPGHAVPE